MANRYINSSSVEKQPIKKIIPAFTDVIHTLKMGERLDNLSQKYYKDPTLSWIIMCANPEFDNEFSISIGTDIRIPLPLTRIFDSWNMTGEI